VGYNLELIGSRQGDHITDLCTNGALTPLCDWMGSLPPARYPAVARFAAEGSYTPSDELALQLEDAFQNHRPDDEDVAQTADRLLDLLGNGDPGETVAIVD
jgi:hypothetical protein